MRYIESLEELCKLVEESEEPIVYPVRDEGIIFLDYFRYTNELYRYNFGWALFVCIAKKELPFGMFTRIIQGLPAVTLKNLPHFKNSGNFFVAAPAEQIADISKSLEDFGCKNVFIATENIFTQMQNKISEFRQSGRISDWNSNYSMKEFEEIKTLTSSQIEITDTHKKSFSEYRNAFRDKKVVIVATGPTLKYYKPIPDAIHIGLNFAWRNENILLDYLFTQDEKINRTTDVKVEDGFDKIKNKIFIGKYPYNDEWFRYSESYSLMRENICRYFLNRRDIGQVIHQDICYYGLADFGSVSFNALHFALFTYPKEIYLVGCDTSPTGHFYDKKSSGSPTNDDMMTGKLKIGYARMKVFAEQYYPDTKIISINPVGLKGLFEDVYTEDYKKFLQEV